MKTIVPKISSSLSKMWNKVLTLNNSLFPALATWEHLGKMRQRILN
ncbi:hypothetical protein [Aliarcobacter cryaerophilus]|uniref:Uncharacterized protein n=1 Tax=Aliarcobacter cryaerophilus TaxID=28198 RepID=A0AA46NQT4_9BACT|nr:hypothetical protein [Aliarcobacter cryaerophilus]UYF44369.1 hypothetical protein NGX11_11160 [Aliarcobacter cryaerophilus]